MATALITGGTSGIGAAFAEELAARGYDLVLVARDPERLASAAALLTSTRGIAVETLRADLAERADVERVVARIEDPRRPIDLLVNNAGSGVRAELTSSDTAAHDRGIAVMCVAVMLLGGAAGRTMRDRGTGAIINVSSLQSLFTTGSYAAMKAWVTSYSQSLSVELRGTGVAVTAVLPGWVTTPWHTGSGARASSIPGWLWISPEVVVRTALTDLDHGRVISTPTWRYRAIGWFARHLPRSVIRWVSGKISSRRSRPVEQTRHLTAPTTTEDP